MSSSDAEQPDLRDVLFTSSQTGTIVYLDSSQVKPEEATSLPCVKTASVPPSGSAEFESVALDSTCSAPMHVVLNPVGGHGEARRYYSAVVEPILAQIPSRRVLLHETQAEGDGRRIGQLLCQENELHLVVIGGDGTVGEVLNGLMLGSNGETLRAGNAELCIIPQGTANALYYSIFRSRSDLQPALAPLLSLISFLRRSSNSRQLPLNIALNICHHAGPSLSPRERVLTSVVTSAALHASLLHDAEALRATMPGLDRFKVAAQQNVSRWSEGTLVLSGHVERYDSARKAFVRGTTGESTALTIDGPFVYLVSALVDRFEPNFVVAPFQAPSASGRLHAPTRPSIDLVLIRPLRHGATAKAYEAVRGDEQAREAVRKQFAARVWAITSGMYGGGTHVDMCFEDEKDVQIVEYLRCESFTWQPATTSDIKSRLVCLDGAMKDLGHGGHLESRILGAGETGITVWV